MTALVRDLQGWLCRPNPNDSRVSLRWRPAAQQRLAEGSDAGQAYLLFEESSDALFAVSDVVAFTKIPIECAALVAATMGASEYRLLRPFDLTMSETRINVPITLVAQDVTISPAAGLSLTTKPGWTHVFLQKTGPRAYTAFGDLVGGD